MGGYQILKTFSQDSYELVDDHEDETGTTADGSSDPNAQTGHCSAGVAGPDKLKVTDEDKSGSSQSSERNSSFVRVSHLLHMLSPS
jgi:hypothetical protein